MSSIFSYAITKNIVDSNLNPTKSFFTGENIYKPQARDRQLSLENELPKFIYQLWDPLIENKVDRLTRDAIFLLLMTGLKKSDVLNMRWDQIHSDSYIKIDKNKIKQIIPITETIKCVLDDLKSYQEDNKSLIGMDYIFFNKKTNKPIENLRKSFIKYSKDLDWVVYPEAIRKTFANICDRTNIPRSHFYQLLGLKKAYNPYETNLDAIDDISQLKRSLELVQHEIDKLAPMLIPGQMTKIREFLYN
jgi:integrase